MFANITPSRFPQHRHPRQRSLLKALFTKTFGEIDRVISSDSRKQNRKSHRKKPKPLPILLVTSDYFWGAVMLDFKICGVAVLISFLCVPIVMLMISIIHQPQFSAHFNPNPSLPYGEEREGGEEGGLDPEWSQSETLFGLVGMNRLLWALWIINLRHLFSPLALKKRRR